MKFTILNKAEVILMAKINKKKPNTANTENLNTPQYVVENSQDLAQNGGENKESKNKKMYKGEDRVKKAPFKTLGRIFKFMLTGKNTLIFIASILCIVLSSYASVQSMAMIEDLLIEINIQLESVKMGLSEAISYSGILRVITTMVIIFVIGVVASYLQNMLYIELAQRTIRDFRDTMFSKMQYFPVRYFDTHTFGETMSRFTNDVDTMQDLISNSIPNIISSLVTITVCLIEMILKSWQLTLVVLITVFLMFFVIKGLGAKSAHFFIKRQYSIGKLNGYIEEMMSGQKVVKVFCHENENQANFDVINEELNENSTKANKYANIFMPIMANLTYVQYVLIAVVGAVLANYNLLTVNDTTVSYSAASIAVISAFLLLSRSFTRPINMVSQQFNAVVMALAGAGRIFDLLDTEPETDEGYVTLVKAHYNEKGEIVEGKVGDWFYAWKHPHGDGTLSYTKLEGHVLLKNVDFSYDGKKQVLFDITVDAKPGTKVALIGKTGAGKTTISNLINRFYDIDDGKIRYDGININKIKKEDLRRSLGVVLQEINLFTDTVMENIRYGNPEATDEQVYAAAKLVHADDFIKRLPEGYNTVLTLDGSNLSQGQRQLLSIARVAVADPPAMILDEATSSIDTRTEKIVQDGMDNLMKGRTVFVIAHRLSTVKNADNIMVMDGGKIIEQGNHDELMAHKGMYYSLYTGSTLE